MIIHSGLAHHVCVLLGYLYPSLASAKAAVQQDATAFNQWMTYWVVMSVFALVEVFVDFFVSWVPFYYEAKIVLIVWLTLPRYQGASQIYCRLLHPYLEHYEGDIDNGLEGMRVEASRRIQSLGTNAAAEIVKAVSRQGFSAKDQLFARVVGVAVAEGAAVPANDRSAVQSAPPPLLPREVYKSSAGKQERDLRQNELQRAKEVNVANASMLLDFSEVMKEGVFVQARVPFDDEGREPWRPWQLRMLRHKTFCLTEPGAELDSQGRVVEQIFEVSSAEAQDTTDRSLLLLRTDRGAVTLSLPGPDDRDSMLDGFEVLLSSSPPPTINGTVVAESNSDRGFGVNEAFLHDRVDSDSNRSRGSAPVVSRRWDRGEGEAGEGLVLASEEETEGEEDGEERGPVSMLPLQKSWVKVE